MNANWFITQVTLNSVHSQYVRCRSYTKPVVDGLANQESLCSSVFGAPDGYMGSHWFESHLGLRLFEPCLTFVTCWKFHISQDIKSVFQKPIETLGEFMSLFEKASQQRFVCLIAALACENSCPSLFECFCRLLLPLYHLEIKLHTI